MAEGMLDEIMSEGTEPEVTTEQVTQAPEPVETAEQKQARDEAGRFAANKAAEASDGDVQAIVEGHEAEGSQVPQQALHAARQREKETRDQNAELTRQLQQLQGQVQLLTQQRQPTPAVPAEPAKAPDFWEDPNKFVESSLTPVQQAIAELRYENSQMRAVAQHTEAGVNAAEEALKAAIQSGQLDGNAVRESLSKSKDPVGDVVRWHLNSPEKQRETLREQIRAEVLAEQNLAPADPTPKPAPANGQAPLTKLPPSLSRIAGAGNSGADNDMSDAGLFQHAIAR